MKPKFLKVLFVVKSSTPYGSNVALINFLEHATTYHIDPLVVYCDEGPLLNWLDTKRIAKTKIASFDYRIYPPRKTFKNVIGFLPRFLYLPFRNSKSVHELTKIAKDFGADIIHTNVGPVDIGFIVSKLLNIPHVWHIREYQDLDFGMHPFPSKAAFKAKLSQSHLISISHDLYDYFEMGNNAKVIYDGVMPENQIAFNAKKEKYFLYVGRISEGKNVKSIVEAFIDFAKYNSDYKLLLAGTGPKHYRKQLDEIVAENKLAHRIDFLGYRSDRFELMQTASALIVSSVSEGFGFITVEAMFNGCLVIGLNSGGTKEILGNNQLGLLYNNNHELLGMMEKVALDGVAKYTETILKAQKIARELYSTEKNASEISNYYHKIKNN